MLPNIIEVVSTSNKRIHELNRRGISDWSGQFDRATNAVADRVGGIPFILFTDFLG